MKKITRKMMALAGLWLLRFVLYVCAWLSLGAMVRAGASDSQLALALKEAVLSRSK